MRSEEKKKQEYESAKFIPMSDIENNEVNAGGLGIPFAVFVAVGGVTVYAGAFIAQVAFYYNVAVGQTKVVSVNG
jgi:hypothetical protein